MSNDWMPASVSGREITPYVADVAVNSLRSSAKTINGVSMLRP